MDWKSFFANIFDAGVWPAVVVFGLYSFRDALADAVKNVVQRLQYAKYRGTEVLFGAQNKSEPEPPEKATKLDIPTPQDNTGLQAKLEGEIRAQLASIPDEDKKINVLIAHLAHSQTQAFFERGEYTIFGSQIRLLEYMAERSPMAINDREARSFYNEYQNQASGFLNLQNYKFENYMGYLESFGMISRSPEGWRLEDPGRAFLIYMSQPGKSKMRAM